MTTFAWLIEAGPDAAHWWWNDGWVQDAWLATRFTTKDEAEAAIRKANLSARAVEHGFMADPGPEWVKPLDQADSDA